jgi:hypothetical protein
LLTEVLEVEALVLLIVKEDLKLVVEQDMMVETVLKEKKRFAAEVGVELDGLELLVEGRGHLLILE